MTWRSSEPLKIHLLASPKLTAGIVLSHGGGVGAVWWSSLPALAAIAISALLAVSFVRAVRRHGLRTAPDSVVRIELDTPLRVSLADGRTIDAGFGDARSVHPWLVSVRIERGDEGAAWLVVPCDAVQAGEDHKALRRALLHGHPN